MNEYKKAAHESRPTKDELPTCPLCRTAGAPVFMSFACGNNKCRNYDPTLKGVVVQATHPYGSLEWARERAAQFRAGQIYGVMWERRFKRIDGGWNDWRSGEPTDSMYDNYVDDLTEWRYTL